MLSDLQVRQAKVTGKAYSLVDFDGLYFHISATGFKAWHFRFTWGG
ncbi:Arm DNA-binding domain-containing protein, partial [Pseudomonas aeruginosa]